MGNLSFTRESLSMTKRGPQKTPEMWEEIIEEWEKSGIQKKVFCKEKSISPTNFRFWMKRLRPSLIGKQSRDTVNQWEAIIEDWKKSGLSRNAYCIQNELLTTALYNWERKLNSSAPRESATMSAVKRWTAIIEDWKKSDCPPYIYCKKKGIIAASFYSWRYRLYPAEYPQCKKERPAPYELTAQDLLMPAALSRPFSSEGSSPSHRIEFMLSQGHSLTLEGYSDSGKLISFLTPLLKREL
jgi:hypothetical protein